MSSAPLTSYLVVAGHHVFSNFGLLRRCFVKAARLRSDTAGRGRDYSGDYPDNGVDVASNALSVRWIPT